MGQGFYMAHLPAAGRAGDAVKLVCALRVVHTGLPALLRKKHVRVRVKIRVRVRVRVSERHEQREPPRRRKMAPTPRI